MSDAQRFQRARNAILDCIRTANMRGEQPKAADIRQSTGLSKHYVNLTLERLRATCRVVRDASYRYKLKLKWD